jgi:hypothetical protein
VRKIESKLGEELHRLAVRNEREVKIFPVPVEFPESWQGATPKQLLNSAKAILGQPGGGEGDPRYQAARWVKKNYRELNKLIKNLERR